MSINLSKFKNLGVVKVIKFNNGKIETVESQKELNGEITFYDIQDKLQEINEVIQGLKGTETEEYVTFLLLPCLTDIIVDVTYDEYLQMIYKPSTQFTYLLSSIAEVINDLFQRAENINNIKETTDTIKKSLPNIAPKETPEQELNRLMNELPKTNDKELRKKMFKRMSELNAEIGD